AVMAIIVACGGNNQKPITESNYPSTSSVENKKEASDYDPNRGEGKFNEQNVVLDATLNTAFADAGEIASGVKCTSCHKMSSERLVGPGWKGVTERRTPYWIMNFITNPDPMIDKDPE